MSLCALQSVPAFEADYLTIVTFSSLPLLSKGYSTLYQKQTPRSVSWDSNPVPRVTNVFTTLRPRCLTTQIIPLQFI